MAVKRPARTQTRPLLVPHDTNDEQSTNRFVAKLADVIPRITQLSRSTKTVDLAIGNNRIQHDLGRVPVGAAVTPTVADATFAWALTAADERLATIAVVGIAMPNARVEFH